MRVKDVLTCCLYRWGCPPRVQGRGAAGAPPGFRIRRRDGVKRPRYMDVFRHHTPLRHPQRHEHDTGERELHSVITEILSLETDPRADPGPSRRYENAPGWGTTSSSGKKLPRWIPPPLPVFSSTCFTGVRLCMGTTPCEVRSDLRRHRAELASMKARRKLIKTTRYVMFSISDHKLERRIQPRIEIRRKDGRPRSRIVARPWITSSHRRVSPLGGSHPGLADTARSRRRSALRANEGT